MIELEKQTYKFNFRMADGEFYAFGAEGKTIREALFKIRKDCAEIIMDINLKLNENK